MAHMNNLAGWRSAGVVFALALLGAAVLLLATLPAYSSESGHELCAVCGRSWPKSPSRMRCEVKLGNHSTQIQVCGPFCLCERLERYAGREYELTSLQIIDYASLDQEYPRWANVKQAAFLVGIKGDIKAACEPLVAAFAGEKPARAAQAKLGGELTAWDKLFQQCVKLAGEYEPDVPPGQRNPNRRPDKR